MKGGRGHHNPTLLPGAPNHFRAMGYTIVEVLIFLAISTGLFVMIAFTFTRQQGRTSFTTAARDMESRVQDVINDISTGYYTRPGNFTCTASLSGPLIAAGGSQQQGTNQGCIFIGRVAHFAGLGNNRYNVYSVVGLRQTQSGARREVQNFAEAQPRAVVNPPMPVDLTDRETLPAGATVYNMYYQASVGGPKTPMDAIGFFSSFGAYDSGSLQTGSLRVNVVPITGVGSPGSSQSEMVTLINGISDPYVAFVGNPEGRTVICINSNSSNQYAELTIGGNDRQLSTDMVVLEGRCPELI